MSNRFYVELSQPVESPLVFYPRRAVEFLTTYGRFLAYAARLERLARRVKREEAAGDRPYADVAVPALAEVPSLEVAAAGAHGGSPGRSNRPSSESSPGEATASRS